MTETTEACNAIETDVVDQDLPCYRCGYNVRGLASDGQCPECAASVGETLRRQAAALEGGLVLLASSDPRWVRGLARACTLLLVAGAGVLATHILSIIELRIPVAAAMPIFLAPYALLVAGVWMSASREPMHAGRRRTWLRVTIRAAIVAWVLSMAAMIWVLVAAPFGAVRYPLLTNGVTSAVASCAFFWRLREFAERLERRWLRHACGWLAIFVSLLCLATGVPGAGEIQVRADAYQMITSEPIFGGSMLLVLLPYSLTNVPRFDIAAVAFAMAALVSVSVFIVLGIFHRALHRAARHSRHAESAPVIPPAAPDGRTVASSRP